MSSFLTLDFPALVAVLFLGLASTLLGNFLLLRKESLLGDSISHSVLPGIVLAYLFTDSRHVYVVFIGALLAGLLSTVIINWIIRFGRVEAGAAMGIVFSIFFALGVLLIEQASSRSLDLDADCLLYGQLETIFWLPQSGEEINLMNAIKNLPSDVIASVLNFLLVASLLCLFWKEIILICFDPASSFVLGLKPRLFDMGFLVVVTLSIVSSFKLVGSILVISLLIVPAASARLLTNRIKKQLFLSLLFAIVGILLGYYLAVIGIFAPTGQSLNAAGMISTVLGIQLFLCVIWTKLNNAKVKLDAN
jgi:manganese/zinc/iron transport system permease protein